MLKQEDLSLGRAYLIKGVKWYLYYIHTLAGGCYVTLYNAPKHQVDGLIKRKDKILVKKFMLGSRFRRQAIVCES